MQPPNPISEASSITATVAQPQSPVVRGWSGRLPTLRPGLEARITALPLVAGLLPMLAAIVVPAIFGGPGNLGTAVMVGIALTALLTIAGWRIGRSAARDQAQMAGSMAGMEAAAAASLSKTLALDGIAASVMLTDDKNHIVYLNKSLKGMFKAAESDLQQELPEFNAESLIGRSVDLFGSSIFGRGGRSAEPPATRRTRIQIGGRTLDLVASPIVDHDGRRLGMVIEWLDRTKELDSQARLEIERAERERSYQRLASEQAADKRQYESLVRNIPGAVYRSDWNADWTMQLMSAGIQNICGYPAEAFLQGGDTTYGSLIHSDDAKSVDDAVSVANAGDTPFTIEYRVRHKDGSERWVFEKGCVVKSADGKPIYLDGAIFDITSRKQTELAMQRIHQEMHSLLDAAAAGDFTKKIDLVGRTGLAQELGESVNALVLAVNQAVVEVGLVMAGLAGGDLTRRVTSDYQGDLGRLRDDINATAEKLALVIGQTVQGMSTIKQSTSELSTGTMDLSSRTEEQAASLEQISGSVRQLADAANQSAENAEQAKQLAHAARNAAENGGAVAQEVTKAMGQIDKSSRRISDIIGMIDDIAFQTNLLALNAAVEAARAGEAGRGFAVVAKEVRSLAQRTSTASKEIKALIVDSNGHVQQGVELVNRAGATLTEIVTSIKRVSDIVSEIAAANREQSASITEVQTAVDQIENATQHNAALVEESNAAVSSVDGQVQGIMDITAFFNTGSVVTHAKAQQAALARKIGGLAVANSPGTAKAAGTIGTARHKSTATAGSPDRDWEEF
jgi:methyl-accepting chemotaxis protein